MANILYLGNTPLIDLSGYATTSYVDTYVDTAVSNVDVTQQLGDYLTIVNASIGFVAKENGKSLSTNDFTDALKTKLDSLENFDPTDISTALSTIQSTLADITDDSSAAVQATIDTWNEIKNFLQDYDNTDTLQSIINATSSSIETWVGQQGYLKSNDVSIYLTKTDASTNYVKKTDFTTVEDSLAVAAAAITVLDSSVSALASSIPTVPTAVSAFTNDAGYQTANDVSTFITAADVPDVSAKVESTNKSVMNIVSISAADYTALAGNADASTLYIVI